MLPLLNVATGWLLFLSLTVALGAAIGRWVVLPRQDHEARTAVPELRAAAARLGRGAAVLLLVSLGLVFLRQLLEFHDPFGHWGEDVRVLLGATAWGTTWILAAAVALAAVVAFGRASRGWRGAWWTATLATLALGAFPALTGHANGGDLRALTLVADTLHVWAVGGWIGGLALVLHLERRQRRGGGEGASSLLPVLVPRFSPLAMACVATLAATGVLAAWIHLGSLGALFAEPYGRLLLLKVTLVLGVLALGAVNWRRLTPRLGEAGGQGAMRRAATLEFVVANVVLAVTAILVRTSPM